MGENARVEVRQSDLREVLATYLVDGSQLCRVDCDGVFRGVHGLGLFCPFGEAVLDEEVVDCTDIVLVSVV